MRKTKIKTVGTKFVQIENSPLTDLVLTRDKTL